MPNNSFHSPLRYPGGKTKLAPVVKKIIQDNGLVDCHYIEPYAGGGGNALALLFGGVISHATLNDYDKSIYAIWHSIIHHNNRFIEAIKNTGIDIETWRRAKEVQLKKADADLFELGFSTFFLNRTNISGVINAGVIGGKAQAGTHKMDARFNKKNLIEKIQRIEKFKEQISVTNKDALSILTDPPPGFMFIDPPYVNKAKHLYSHSYDAAAHREVARILLEKTNSNWLLCYDQCALIEELYFTACRNKFDWKLAYGASNRKAGEYLIAGDNLKVNEFKSELLTLTRLP